MRARTFIALFIAAALTSIGPTRTPLAAASSSNVIAQTVTALPGTTQPVALGQPNQIHGRVACDGVSYTEDDLEGTSTIRYFNFATNTSQVLPGNGIDRMADTDGRRVAFTQLEGPGDSVILYDLATQLSTRIPGELNRDPVIGGNIVAFAHGDYGASEIDIYDQSSGNVTPLTADALRDQSPAVSPDGTVVVWEKCQADLTGCDIYSAIRDSAGAYTTRLLTGSGEDRFPDTNGDIVVYVSNKSGENDLYFQRVGGSTEMHLAIPGDQVDPHISGDLIAFLSQVDGEYDVFMYDLHSATLYQVTNTPQVREQYVDIAVGCNGTNRIVYTLPGSGSSDVYEFSFQLSDSIADQLNDLIALVQSFNLHDGTEASLISKLEDALTALSVSDTATACDSLTAFINASQAQTGKKLTADQVKLLVDSAAQIKTGLGCQ